MVICSVRCWALSQSEIIRSLPFQIIVSRAQIILTLHLNSLQPLVHQIALLKCNIRGKEKRKDKKRKRKEEKKHS